MTREEAIQRLKNIDIREALQEDYDAIDMAIEALSADTVSREFYEDVVKANHGLAKENSELKKQIESMKEDVARWSSWNKTFEQSGIADLISRADAIGCLPMSLCYDNEPCVDAIKSLPSADRPKDVNTLYAIPKANYVMPLTEDLAIEYLQEIGWLQNHDKEIGRPQGEWIEMEALTDEDSGITEWQSARCSVCGKYHTTPYMYYFDRFNYCPNCGARMKGGAE